MTSPEQNYCWLYGGTQTHPALTTWQGVGKAAYLSTPGNCWVFQQLLCVWGSPLFPGLHGEMLCPWY